MRCHQLAASHLQTGHFGSVDSIDEAWRHMHDIKNSWPGHVPLSLPFSVSLLLMLVGFCIGDFGKQGLRVFRSQRVQETQVRMRPCVRREFDQVRVCAASLIGSGGRAYSLECATTSIGLMGCWAKRGGYECPVLSLCCFVPTLERWTDSLGPT